MPLAPGVDTITAVATNVFGNTAEAQTVIVRKVAEGGQLARISDLRASNRIFVVGRSSTPLTAQAARRHDHRVGTVFSFVLDRSAMVTIAIQTHRPGTHVGRRCKRTSRNLRHKPRCTRIITKATLIRIGHSGLNEVAFTGRIQGQALAPGTYTAVFTAIDAEGASKAAFLTFTIARR
jgi:hypothetical protein